MARLEIEVGGSDKGGNSELQQTIGLLEKLIGLRSALNVDLIKADNVDDIKSIGESLTNVNIRIGQYLNLASKATDAWKDDRTATILDNLSSRIAVVQANTKSFGTTVQSQTSELRAYQQAFDNLIANGLDRTNTEVMSVERNISRLTGVIATQKSEIAEQKAYDTLDIKLKQISANTKLMGDAQRTASTQISAYQAAISGLIKAGIDPADDKIKDLQASITTLNSTMSANAASTLANSFRKTGVVLEDARNKVRQLQHYLNFATSEQSVAKLNKRLAEAQTELKRLNTIGLTADQAMSKFGNQSNSVGVEFARIIQDAPYATTALGAIQNNFGAIGNNITRLTELLPQYTDRIRAVALESGKAATSGEVLRKSLLGLVSGSNGLILGISLLVSVIQVWTALSQKRQRELEKEKKKEQELTDTISKRINAMSALNQAQLDGQKDAVRELTSINTLRKTIEDETVSRENRLKAIKELRKIAPDHFKSLTNEQLLTEDLSVSYNKLADSIMRVALAKAAEDKLVEVGKENLDIEFSILDITRKRTEEAEKLIKAEQERAKLAAVNNITQTSTGPGGVVVRGSNDRADLALRKEIANAEGEIAKVSQENQELLTKRRQNLEQMDFLQGYILQGQREGVFAEEKTTKSTTERVKALKEIKQLNDGITGIYQPDTDRGNLAGLDGLFKTNQASINRYTKLLGDVSAKEAEWTAYFTKQVAKRSISAAEGAKQITQIQIQAGEERKQILAGQDAEIKANTQKFVNERAQILAELENRAGQSRIKSRDSELAAERAYWSGREAELKKYNISAEQITELRKAGEAEINKKWDQKMVEDSFIYQRRNNESLTQLLIRRLNKETALELKSLEGNTQAKLDLQRRYFQQLNALQAHEQTIEFMADFDGDFFSVQFDALKVKAELFTDALRAGKVEVGRFGEAMAALSVQREQLTLLKSGFDSLTGSIGDAFTGVIFGAEDAFESLGKAFTKVAQNIVSGLVSIAVRAAINQAIGTSSMAANVAASAGAAKAVAASWATAAALVSAATFGASSAAGGAALAGLVASSKALAGFYTGGYTGNGGRRKIAGVVHGQEFVVNARATKDNMPYLRAMNAGADLSKLVPGQSKSVSFGSLRDPEQNAAPIAITGNIRNGEIKISNDRANRFVKKFGRG